MCTVCLHVMISRVAGVRETMARWEGMMVSAARPSFLVENVPAGYANDQCSGCRLSNTDVLMVIFAVMIVTMMAGEGCSMVGEPDGKFQQACQAGGPLLRCLSLEWGFEGSNAAEYWESGIAVSW